MIEQYALEKTSHREEKDYWMIQVMKYCEQLQGKATGLKLPHDLDNDFEDADLDVPQNKFGTCVEGEALATWRKLLAWVVHALVDWDGHLYWKNGVGKAFVSALECNDVLKSNVFGDGLLKPAKQLVLDSGESWARLRQNPQKIEEMDNNMQQEDPGMDTENNMGEAQ